MMDKLGKQSRENSRKEPSQTSLPASQTRGSSPCNFYKCCFPSPEPDVGTRRDRRLLFGIHLGSASEAKSHTLLRRGSRPLRSRGGASPQSRHLQNARTFRSRPGGCPNLRALPRLPDEPLCPSPFILGGHLHSTVFYRSYLSK